jgi:hypothetical protein
VILKALVCSVALSRLTLKLNDLFVIESLLEELLSGTKNDCANRGRASAVSRNNSEQLIATIDRMND